MLPLETKKMGGGAEESAKETSPAAAPSRSTAVVDRPLGSLGFVFSLISPEKVSGRLKVVETCCQPFDVLNGGVSALMAESTASMGAFVASGFRRIAGLQLSINHVRPALLGEEVEAEAKPVHLGGTIQVWEVQIRKVDPSTSTSKELVSTSRVTVLCFPRSAESVKDFAVAQTVKKFAKL